MGIPIQAQAIPMNSCNVKARLQYIEAMDKKKTPDHIPTVILDMTGSLSETRDFVSWSDHFITQIYWW